MRVWSTVCVLVVVVCSVACGRGSLMSDEQESFELDPEGASWSVYRGDRQLTGIASGWTPRSVELLWSFTTDDLVVSSPVIGDGVVFVGSGDATVSALALATGEPLWRFQAGAPVESPPLLVEDAVVFGTLGRELVALQASTGDERWRYMTNGKITGSANWVTGPDGRTLIVVGSYDAAVHSVDLITGDVAWIHETSSYINGGPAVAENSVFFAGCDALLHRVAAVDGTEIAAVDVGSYAAASPAVHDSMVFVGTYGGEVVAVDLEQNAVAWRYENADDPQPFVSSPAVTADLVVVGSRDARVHALDRETGAVRWTFLTQDEVDSSPVVVGEAVVVGSVDGRLYGLGLEDGELLWSYDLGSPISATPAVGGGYIVIACEDGRIHAFAARPTGAPEVTG